jgi:hypothetical protein
MVTEQYAPLDIESTVAPHYKPIVDIVLKGWDIWLEASAYLGSKVPGIYIKNRTIGSTMSDILRALFKEYQFESPKLIYRERNGLFFIVINDEVVIRFNLMDKDGNTLHTPTRQAKQYLSQNLLIPNKTLKYLYAGYVMDATKTQILNIYLLERSPSGVPTWMIDMNGNMVQQMPLLFTKPVTEEAPQKRVTAKKKNTGTDTQTPKTGSDNV